MAMHTCPEVAKAASTRRAASSSDGSRSGPDDGGVVPTQLEDGRPQMSGTAGQDRPPGGDPAGERDHVDPGMVDEGHPEFRRSGR